MPGSVIYLQSFFIIKADLKVPFATVWCRLTKTEKASVRKNKQRL